MGGEGEGEASESPIVSPTVSPTSLNDSPTPIPTLTPSPEASETSLDEGAGEATESPIPTVSPTPSTTPSPTSLLTPLPTSLTDSPTLAPSPEVSEPTPSLPQTWTMAQLRSKTETGNPDKCYVAIFAGDACSSDGGIYRISRSWFANHPGGNFGDLGTCGNVRAFWLDMSGNHKQFASKLASYSDLGSFASFAAELACTEDVSEDAV